MKYTDINDRELLIKEYDLVNRMIVHKNRTFNSIIFALFGFFISIFFNPEQKMDTFYIISIIIITLIIVLVIIDFISEKIYKSDKVLIEKRLLEITNIKNNEIKIDLNCDVKFI